MFVTQPDHTLRCSEYSSLRPEPTDLFLHAALQGVDVERTPHIEPTLMAPHCRTRKDVNTFLGSTIVSGIFGCHQSGALLALETKTISHWTLTLLTQPVPAC